MDPEIINDLIEQIDSIKEELTPIIENLKKDSTNLDQFKNCGQLIDRIYGTVSTLGMKNFAEYTGLLKDICYVCSESKRPAGRARVISLLEGAFKNFDSFVEFLANPKDTENFEIYNKMLNVEKARAVNLIETVYHQIKAKSIIKK